jgi:alpha-tubulin suppressor-like RCC1 family protein
MAYGNTGFKEGSTDVFDRYVSKEYLMEYYPDLLPSKIAPRLWTWGDNSDYQLGANITSASSRSSPGTTAGGGTNWKQVASAGFLAAAVKTDGTLWTWGNGLPGGIGDNNPSSWPASPSSGVGTIRASPGTTSGGGTNWKQVSVGGYTMAAVKTDGTLWTWGSNYYGQLGDGTVRVGYYHKASPGTTAGGGTNWKQAACGTSYMAAIKTDGTLWTWGINGYGQLGDGTMSDRSSPGTTAGGGTNWKQVACVAASNYNDSNVTAAIKTDGTLWTWGAGATGYGFLGAGSITSRSSPGTIAGGGTNWKQVSCGSYSAAAIKTDGTLWTWGYNGSGQLGDGTTTNRDSPVTISGGGTNWKQVSVGPSHGIAVKTDGTLWTWGSNGYGQLGTGNTTSRSSPVTVAGGGTNWKQVYSGNFATFAINESGNW